eukprot:SAG31_NODE_20640_length_569_cov_0.648936_1_plen_100_part_00
MDLGGRSLATTVSTDPRDMQWVDPHSDGPERDSAWGQALQLLEGENGTPVTVHKGEWLLVKSAKYCSVCCANDPVLRRCLFCSQNYLSTLKWKSNRADD